jgi:hypothetical protein
MFRFRARDGRQLELRQWHEAEPDLARIRFSDEQAAFQFLCLVPAEESTNLRRLLRQAIPSSELSRMSEPELRRQLAWRLSRDLLCLVETRWDATPGGITPAPPQKRPPGTRPPGPGPAKEKSLKASWSPAEACCGDRVEVVGTGVNLASGPATASLSCSGGGAPGTLKGTGGNSFTLPWEVANVTFTGARAPARHDVTAQVTADGISARTEPPLAVKRVPDKAAQPVTITRSSGRYGWTASFKLAIEGDTVKVTQVLQIKKAWLGKQITFDPKKDKVAGKAFIKKVGSKWVYYDAAAKVWKDLPRRVSAYTVKEIIFVQSGTSYVGRDDASLKWPEAFPAPANYEKMKAAWLGNIKSVWESRFTLHRKGCKSTAKGCCTWKIRILVSWSDSPGDKLVYAVWAQDYGRSNARDWYLSDPDPATGGHEDGHLLGAYDEYTGGAVDPVTKKIENDSIMGSNLTKSYPRHLDGVRDEAAKLINGLIGRRWSFEVKGGS